MGKKYPGAGRLNGDSGSPTFHTHLFAVFFLKPVGELGDLFRLRHSNKHTAFCIGESRIFIDKMCKGKSVIADENIQILHIKPPYGSLNGPGAVLVHTGVPLEYVNFFLSKKAQIG